MPEVFRIPARMDCGGGLDLVHPIDRMPKESFPYLSNIRVRQEGILESRPGYSLYSAMLDEPNSIRRLNDQTRVWAPDGYTSVGGGGTKLYVGPSTSYSPIDTGYSGNPLSLIPFRPDQSPETWMYVFDSLKQVKVRPDGVIRSIGVAPPPSAPDIEYGVPASVSASDGQVVTGWAAAGTAGSLGLTDRTNASSPTVANILYNGGNLGVYTGWCCINPNLGTPPQSFWVGNRMKVILNYGGSNQETVVVREVHPAISTTAIQAIQYDNSAPGMCSVVFTNYPVGLERNSLIELGVEIVRVLEVVYSPDGSMYSVRCFTDAPHIAGETVTGLMSWYCYTAITHAVNETITSSYVSVAQTTGVGALQNTGNVDVSQADGRPIDPANDYLHLSIFLQNPLNVSQVAILLSLDATPNFSFTAPGNSYIFTITGSDVSTNYAGDVWVELVLPISSAIRVGNDPTLTLANVSGVSVQLTTTGACSWGIDWMYLFGTYGPTVIPGSPTGLQYAVRYRDFSTGARSVPSPLTRYSLFPLRESVIITPQVTAQSGVDTDDIYRLGASITTAPLYVGATPNGTSFTDTLPDSSVLKVNQPIDTTTLQLWPLQDLPWSGTVEVVGTTVIWQSGTQFNTALVGATAILINGVVYLTQGQPLSNTMLELSTSAGYLASATFQIQSPTLAGQPLPFAFGPLEGPFAPLIFGLGDPRNGGTLYFTNFSDADSASDQNSIELSSPSSDLVSGTVWKGMCFAGTKDDLYCVRYSYLTTIGATNNNSFMWTHLDSPSGFWSRWSVCTCPLGVAYLGRDGIYIATDGASVNISDEKLYPMFQHDGAPAIPVVRGGVTVYPVDMTQPKYLRTSYCDECLRFSYVDTNGTFHTLRYEIYKKRWFLDTYADPVLLNYLVEATSNLPTDQEILQLAKDNGVMLSGGNTDNGTAIASIVLTPSLDGGDERVQKLYVDVMNQADGVGTVQFVLGYDNATSFSPALLFSPLGVLNQFLSSISTIGGLKVYPGLKVYRNICAKYTWTGGPSGPRLYAWEPSGYLQPYLLQKLTTQFLSLSFPGWKHMRRMYPALVSVAPSLFTVVTQDGRTFGPYTIPSTGGQYRILPQMLDQNLKDLAFQFQLDGQGSNVALFSDDFVVETKEWIEDTYIRLAVFKT